MNSHKKLSDVTEGFHLEPLWLVAPTGSAYLLHRRYNNITTKKQKKKKRALEYVDLYLFVSYDKYALAVHGVTLTTNTSMCS